MIKLVPVVTEKALADRDWGRFHFWFSPKVTKKQAAASFFQFFGHQPLKVTSQIRLGKVKTDWRKRQKYYQSNRKKVIITLPKGTKLELLTPPKKS